LTSRRPEVNVQPSFPIVITAAGFVAAALTRYERDYLGPKMDEIETQQELGADGNPAGVELEPVAYSEEPFDPASISIEPKVVPMDTLLRRLRQGTIRLAPTFQRNYVWDAVRQSQLIESLMLRIPLPMFYVSANEDGSWDVVDGLQRLTTVRNFLLGEELDGKGKKVVAQATPFPLKKLEFWGDRFDGKTFSTILKNPAHARIVNNIMETEMRFTVINPGTPEDVKRNIFKRINTGGMPLTAQEIRHALYQGHSTSLLEELSKSRSFKKATDESIDDSRMAARELVLRFIAFSIRDIKEYSGDMDKFLSDTMRVINCMPDLSNERLKKVFRSQKIPYFPPTLTRADLIAKFELSMARSREFFGVYAFRKAVPLMRRTPVNKALFESWANIFARLPDEEYSQLVAKKSEFFEQYEQLLKTSEFERAVGRDASIASGIRVRYSSLIHLVQSFTKDQDA
jgi:hypothetical protein